MALTTLDAVKIALGIPPTDTSQDARLTQLMAQVEALIRGYLRRQLDQGAFTEYPEGRHTPFLRLREYPVQSITSVKIDSERSFGAGTDLIANVDYRLVNGTLLRTSGRVWPGAYQKTTGLLYVPTVPSRGIIQVVYTAGYATIPQDIVLHAHEMIALALDMAGRGRVATSESLEDYSASYQPLSGEDLLAGHRQALNRYRRQFA